MGMLLNRISDWANDVKDGDAKRREAKRSLDAFMVHVATPPTPLLKTQQRGLYGIVETALLQVCTLAANDQRRPGLEYTYQGALALICEADVREKARLGVPGFEKWWDGDYNRKIAAGEDYFPPGAKRFLDGAIAQTK